MEPALAVRVVGDETEAKRQMVVEEAGVGVRDK